MFQTLSRFILSIVVLVASFHVFANSSVPVSDLANDIVTPSLVIPKPMQPDSVAVLASTNNTNAQMFDFVELLQLELRQLRGQVEELNYSLERLKQDQKQRYLDLDRRIVSLSNQPASATGAPSTTVASQVIQFKDTSSQVSDTTSVEQTAVVVDVYDPEIEKADYKAAFALIRERQYDASIVALLAFIKDFPKGELIGNAHYWLGEVYMVQGDASLASQSFEHVITQFPKHRKIPDALYKAGVAYQNIGDTGKANEALKRVLSEFPESSAARLARERVN
jgi:tol-pal system protein YbgF